MKTETNQRNFAHDASSCTTALTGQVAGEAMSELGSNQCRMFVDAVVVVGVVVRHCQRSATMCRMCAASAAVQELPVAG